MSYHLAAVIEKDSDGYYAYCPTLMGCQSQGETLEEVQVNIREAIALYLETLTSDERKKLSHPWSAVGRAEGCDEAPIGHGPSGWGIFGCYDGEISIR